MRRRWTASTCMAILGWVCGCNPQWHSGYEARPMLHSVEEAAALRGEPDSLSVTGSIDYDRMHMAVTDYGIRVDRAEDDTGKPLALRSFQIFWAKGMYFEAVFESPNPAAKSVSVELVFATRSGVQRIKKTLPIRRDQTRSFLHSGSGRWRPGPYRRDLSGLNKDGR